MKIRIAAVLVVGLLAGLTLAVPAVEAQAPCTYQSFTGTYVFHEKGSSAILNPTPGTYPLHWDGALAPFVALGQVTIANGTGNGFYWIRIGTFTAGPEPVPLVLTITELKSDCTGRWQFEFDLLGESYLIEERFILFDNGRQFRSIPTITGVPTMAWIGEGHRARRSDEPISNCGPQTARGTYLMAAENLVQFGANPLFADAVLLHFNVSNGEVSGMLYEKLGPTGNIELPLSGSIVVNPDCSFEMTVTVQIGANLVDIPVRGVFFDEGKAFYGLNVRTAPGGTQYSFGRGERIGQ